MNQHNDWRQRDPDYAQEKQRYDRPAPSRRFILQELEAAGTPRNLEQMVERMGLEDEEDIEGLRRRLVAMARDGEIAENRRGDFGLIERMDMVRGRVIGHADGFGFLVPEDGSSDLYLSPREMRTLLHGDRALVRVRGVDRRGRREGAVVKVLEHNTTQIVGRVHRESGVVLLQPDNRRIAQPVLLPDAAQSDVREGQMVVADVIEPPTKHSPPVGRIREILGDHMAPGMEIDVAIRVHGIPHEWPEGVDAEARQFSEEVPEAAKQGRRDIRDLPLVTIDDITARDFDDALYCERHGNGWRLIVAIAEVSWYVEAGSEIDKEAQVRATSVYFPAQVVPMLPEVLSNGLCSLNPDVDRLCMICEMQVDAQGRVTDSTFHEGLMRSSARLTYNQVAAAVESREPSARDEISHVLPQVEALYEVFAVLRKAREKRGAIDFDSSEVKFEFDENRKISQVVPVTRHDAHKLVEECMIAANVAAARFLEKNKFPLLYRVHERPVEDRIVDLRAFLGEIGMQLGGGEEPQSADFARVSREAQQRQDSRLIQMALLRTLSRAEYTPENAGHFGLALESYAHFTSPIRRYPDLLVHRAIRAALSGQQPADFRYSHGDMEKLGIHCSMAERRADDATRDVEDWLKCEFMLDRVGEEFAGTIATATPFGLFVRLDDLNVEGLVHVSALDNDYYHFEAVSHRLIGERTRKVYRVGDRLRVKVMRVDLDERKIDFEPAGEDSIPADMAVRGKRSGGGGKGKSGPGGKKKTGAGGKKPESGSKQSGSDDKKSGSGGKSRRSRRRGNKKQ